MRANQLLRCLPVLLALSLSGARAQEGGSLDPAPLPPLASAGPSTPAKEVFGRKARPARLPPRAIGFYSRGCFAGGQALPLEGQTWQVMRPSRNRYWGHPKLIAFLEQFSAKVPAINGWPGILVGDVAQPRGGPMITGHASHQIGLDADLWLTAMPGRKLSRSDREEIAAINLVRQDRRDVDPSAYTLAHMKLVRAMAQEPEVARIFINPAIKRALCRDAGPDRAWLAKVRPLWGHNYHFHVRLHCPPGECRDQDPVPQGDGCGDDLDRWFTREMLFPGPGAPPPPLLLSQLPAECSKVLAAP
ncbi:penicillin-insensitive murein endopeptidase [Enterovirga sp.]|uniref:penicillin-insensitive murein endopeptidase n=1 Tax=Enterovirga sp. TaxID=2026350 RepID=UPI002C76BB72|nr:penicillin-insensitive murein endopeptidase [Enterovirga sp.]HMO29227.1 penicillin-insensitive murein endopeptidase [Enterovirga sp.]